MKIYCLNIVTYINHVHLNAQTRNQICNGNKFIGNMARIITINKEVSAMLMSHNNERNQSLILKLVPR